MADTSTVGPTVEKKKRRSRGNRLSARRVAKREARMAAGREGFLAREAKREAKRQQEELNDTMIVEKSATLVHESNNLTKPSTTGQNLKAPPALMVIAASRSATGLPTAQCFDTIDLSPPLSCTPEDIYKHSILVNTELRSPWIDDRDSNERLNKAMFSLLRSPKRYEDNWLDDETITVNLEAINIPANIKVFSASWAADYSRQYAVYIKAFDNLNYTDFIIPFHSGSGYSAHWSLIHIRRLEKVVDYYNSLRHDYIIPSATELVYSIIQKHQSAFPGVYKHNDAICQEQPDGHSCGLFVILNATCLIQNQPIWLQGATPQWIRWKSALHLSQFLPEVVQVYCSHIVNSYFDNNYRQIQSAIEAETKSNDRKTCSLYLVQENLDKAS